MPDTWVPTVTDVTGSMVPVAVMLFSMLAGPTASVANSTSSFSLLPESRKAAAAATTMTATMTQILLIFFIKAVCNVILIRCPRAISAFRPDRT